MRFLPFFRRLGFGLMAFGFLVLAEPAMAASNGKRTLKKFSGAYKGVWKAAGNLPVTLRMPKGKGGGSGTFEATPCTPGDGVSPLKLRITKYTIRRNGRKLISTGKATWERSKVAALIGSNLKGKLRVNAVLKGNKATAKGKMATGRLSGGLNVKQRGKLKNAVCSERTFSFSGVPADIPDDINLDPDINGTLIATLNVSNSVAVISDLDVSVSIVNDFNRDFDVSLRHVPSGIEVELFTDIGWNDNGIFVRLDDDAATDIGDVPDGGDPGDPPIVGTFRPESPAVLSAFNGVLGSGTWQLIVEDDSSGLTGTLTNFTLHIK